MKRSELGLELALKIKHIAIGRRNRPGTTLRPKYITVHNTDNTKAGAGAAAHDRFVREVGYYIHEGKTKWISWHYTVDDVETYNHLPLNEIGWHAGTAAANQTSIGIEVCMNSDIDQDAAFLRARKLVACLIYDLGLFDKIDETLRAHFHWTQKKCPRLLFDRPNDPNDRVLGNKWANFVADVKTLVSQIQPG
jgi:N-acetylmuramoyl-L-alanine amidase